MLCTPPNTLMLAAVSLIVAGACGDTPSQVSTRHAGDATARGAGAGKAGASPGYAGINPDAFAPRSPIPAAREAAKRSLDSPKSIAAAVASADALAAYLIASPDAADARGAAALSAKLRLLAVGAAAGLQTGPAARALGGDGAQARQLRKALATVESLERGGRVNDGPGLTRLALAVRALLGSDPDEKSIEFDRRAAMRLALGETAEGSAVRAKWLVRLEDAWRELRQGASELRFFGFSRAAGRILCAGCSDAHHVTPDNVTKFLLNRKGNRNGLLCEAAFRDVTPAVSVSQTIERFRRCHRAFNVDERVEDNVWWGANTLALATMATARRLADAPVPRTPLEAAVRKRAAALNAALQTPVVLPVPAVLGPPPELSKSPRDGARTAGVVGLGFGGLTVNEEPLELYAVAPDGLRAGLRTVIGYDAGGAIVSYTRDDGPLSKLLRTGRGGSDGRGAGETPRLLDAIKGLRSAAQKRAARHRLRVSQGDDRGAVAEIIVDADASARDTIALIDQLKAAGYGHFRFVKTAAHGRTLPLRVRSAPESLVAQIKPGFDRPMIAVVHRGHVDLWAPRGRNAGARKRTRAKARLPEEVEAGYRGGEVIRFRIRPRNDPKVSGFDASVAVKAQKALRYFERWHGAGPLLHVIAAPGARAADVLRIARTYQERRGRGEIHEPGKIWAGTACGGKSYLANRKQPEGCPTGVSIAFSRARIPTARGLVKRYIEKKKKKKKKKKKPLNPMAASSCSKARIESVMNNHRGAFRRCYEKRLRVRPDLKGQVVVAFTIGVDGRVRVPIVETSTLNDPAVHRCLVTRVGAARFDVPASGVCQIRWPLRFQPR